MQPVTIVKIGGKILDNPSKLQQVLFSFSKIKGHKILIHGGGSKSKELSEKLGIAPQIVEDRHITDSRTLELVVMVYAGLVNKTVVGQLQSYGCDAIGLSGADGNSILAKKRKIGPVNFGFAGDIKKIYTPFITTLLNDGLTPVFCAITHNGKGQLLNTNADSIAAALATALTSDYEVTLQYCIEKNGVLPDPDDDHSVLATLTKKEYKKMKKNGLLSSELIPKLDNAFSAKKANVHKVFIGGAASIIPDSDTRGTEIIK
ncbi:MAG TPA: acetylglutamate kinase [Bacteroidetes bacterium]|nr:acetylglutamate kinase [Bacteroidota bacterium]